MTATPSRRHHRQRAAAQSNALLTANATDFFWKMNETGNRKLRHTPSMMTLPTMVEIFEERDEEDMPVTPLLDDDSEEDHHDYAFAISINRSNSESNSKSNSNESAHSDEHQHQNESKNDNIANNNDDSNPIDDSDSKNNAVAEIPKTRSRSNGRFSNILSNSDIKQFLPQRNEDEDEDEDEDDANYNHNHNQKNKNKNKNNIGGLNEENSERKNSSSNSNNSNSNNNSKSSTQSNHSHNSYIFADIESDSELKDDESVTMQVAYTAWFEVDDEESHSDDKSEDSVAEHKHDEHSNTKENENENENENTLFEECGIIFDFDDKQGIGKSRAIDFFNGQYFFQFIYDRFHMQSQFLLDTSLPIYSEWKKMRKVRIRTKALKTVDYSLKSCIESVEIMKTVVRNCLLLCLNKNIRTHTHTHADADMDADTNTNTNTDANMEANTNLFKGCAQPLISEKSFECGHFSIVAAWDLFDAGSTPNTKDWNFALNSSDFPAQYLCNCDPDLRHLSNDEITTNMLYHRYKQYQFFILTEYIHLQNWNIKFGEKITWKTIVKKRSDLNLELLKIWENITYFLNPSINNLSELMSNSMNRIIADPIVWLLYMELFMLERQEKLQKLFMTAKSYLASSKSSTNKTKIKGQKLNSLIETLANQAKDESDRLRNIMSKLPAVDDLRETFERQLLSGGNMTTYVKSYNSRILTANKKSVLF